MFEHYTERRVVGLMALALLAGFFLGYGVFKELDEPGYLGISTKPDTAQEARADTIRQLKDSARLSIAAADSIRVDTVRVVEARADSTRLTARLDSLLVASDSLTRVKVGVAAELAAEAARAPLVAKIGQQEDEIAALRRGLLFGRRRQDLLQESLDAETQRANALAAENLQLQGRIDELRTQRTLSAGVGFLSGAAFGFFAAR